MKRKNKLPELLSPAGNFDALLAAISAGADAVYIGGKSFGARAYAKNFDIDEIKRAVEVCHIHGVKLYVTVNTLVYDKELCALSDFAEELYKAGVDAVISADLGAISEIRRRAPRLKIHASTQMSVHNTEGADLAFSLGCERVVLARELSRENIFQITEKAKPFTEVFLHGALCVCHSGQCLMSSLVGGRSGNRGECAQPCRLPYGKGYPLSLKDLSLHRHIKELIESGVDSLKIEGRMKSPEYVYRVTKIYRTLLDGMKNGGNAEEEELKRVFSRGGFTDGYFVGNPGGMLGIRTEEDKGKTRSLETKIPAPEKLSVTASASFSLGEPSRLTLSLGERTATVYGASPRTAQSSPLTEEVVKARLMKMGGTEFSLEKKDIDLTLEEGINLSPGEINALRRSAAEALMNESREGECNQKFTNFKNLSSSERKPGRITAYFHTYKLLREVLQKDARLFDIFSEIYLPLNEYSENAELCEDILPALPPVITESEKEGVKKMLSLARERGAKRALISNLSHISLVKAYGLTPTGDFRLNVTNSLTSAEYIRLGVDGLILSPELTLPMARDIGGSVIVYGRIPLMLTERCFIKENFGCDSCGSAVLRDRTGIGFPIIREYPHRNLILNSTPTYMGDKLDELFSAGLSSHHFIFTVESAEQACEAVFSYKEKKPLPYSVRRMGKRS